MTRRSPAAWLGLALIFVGGTACSRLRAKADPADASAPDAGARPTGPVEIGESIYDGGIKSGWHDGGWAPHESSGPGPAKVRFSGSGVWILEKPGLDAVYGGLVFRVKRPPGESEFLEVRVESNALAIFPRVKVSPADCTDVGDGWTDVFVPMAALDPEGLPFARIVFRAFRPVGSDWVLFDKVGLAKGAGGARAVAYDVTRLRRVTLTVDCAAKARPISPYIYGMAYYPFVDDKAQAAQWLIGATSRRWGGNATTTYNPEIDAWNNGRDWYFENHRADFPGFLAQNAEHKVRSVVTVPIMGWVAKDDTTVSFPVSVYGPQAATDPYNANAGNGVTKDNKPLAPKMPPAAYVPITPAMVKKWVETIGRSNDVYEYILDNEPALWNGLHRDAHPQGTSYDELVKRSIDFGTAVRQAAPNALIAGPAEWGWPGFMYSGKDMAEGGPAARPDRRAHGDLPMMAYYLKAMAEEEKRTGVHILDALDLHAYPQCFKDNAESDDPATAALRIRSTRSLWDPTYVDESWIGESVTLLPRMRDWIDKYYPGRGISIGEWNYAGEKTTAGGLAVAEVLGRYAEYGVTSAYYWTFPPEGSPAMWAFKAFRDFDGKGGRFLDWFTKARAVAGTSIFVSRDETGKHLVAVTLNLSRTEAIGASIDVSSCGAIGSAKAYAYGGRGDGGTALTEVPSRLGGGSSTLVAALAPYSINVYDIELDDAVSVVK